MATLSTPLSERKPKSKTPHRRGDVSRSGGRVEPTPATQFSVYSGIERLGSYRRLEDSTFEAFDKRGRAIGIFSSKDKAIDAIDAIASNDSGASA